MPFCRYGHPMPDGRVLCDACGEYEFNPLATAGGKAAIQDADLIDATNVKATTPKRVVTGGPWDLAWGPPNDPGFVPGTTSVLGGFAGSGKSTLCLQVTPAFARITGRPGYYISGEQEKEELAFTLSRLNIALEPGQLRLVNSMRSNGVIDESVLTQSPPGLVIVDSISTLAGAKDYDAQADLVRRYKPIATKYQCVVLMISQMNKQGNTLGMTALQHDPDTLIDVDTMEKDYRRRNRVLRDHAIDGDPDLRALVAFKNRYGPTFQYLYLIMGPNGLEALPPMPKNERRSTGDALADHVLALDELEDEEKELRERLREIKEELVERKEKIARMAAAKQKGAAGAAKKKRKSPRAA